MQEEQVQTATQEQSPETKQPETEKTVVEQVGELLNEESQAEQLQEPKEEVQPQEPEINEDKEPTIIDDSVIEQYPTLRMYKGKPVSEIIKAYDSFVRKATPIFQENAELKRKLINIPKPEEAPDMVEKPEEFKKWLSERDEKIREEERNKLLQQPQQVDYLEEVKKYLPQDVDVQQVVDAWASTNAMRLFDETGELRQDVKSFYSKNPEIWIQEMVSFYGLLSKAQKNELEIKSKGKELAYDNMKNAIRKTRSEKENIPNATVNPISRTTSYTPEEEMLIRIGQLLPH